MYILEEKILPISKKLKSIRKALGLKQEEVTNGEISRSLISYIENGKVELTEDTAEIISKCMQKVMDEKKISLIIDSRYLMKNEEEQAELVLNRYIERLKLFKRQGDTKKFKIDVNKVENIMDKWDLPHKKVQVYEIIGDYYFELIDYSESYIYYVKALKNSIKINNDYNYAKILTKVGRCCIKINMYWQAIKYNEYALTILNINEITEKKMLKRCLFNNALAYNFLKNYSKCIEEINKLEELFEELTIKEKLDVLMLKGNCYRNKGELDFSEKVYNDMLDISKELNDNKIVSMIYTNISILYTQKDEIKVAILYDKKALKIREQINDEKMVTNLLSLGRKYKVLKEYDLAEKYLLRGLKVINKTKKIKTYVEVCIQLLDTYIHTKEHYLILNLIKEVQTTYKNYENDNSIKREEVMETFLLKAASYLVDKDVVQVKELLALVLERKGDL